MTEEPEERAESTKPEDNKDVGKPQEDMTAEDLEGFVKDPVEQ